MVIDFWNVLNVSLFQKRNKVKDVVLEIAHKELVLICPRCIVDSWSTPLSALHREVSSPDFPLEMFARGKPTNEKIINCVITISITRSILITKRNYNERKF